MRKLSIIGLPSLILSQESSEGTCLLSHSHKVFPSAEPMLGGECRQWRANSCCSTNTANKIHNLKGKNSFDHGHCGKLSDRCLVKMFRQWCLYQCDPYLEKWVVNWTAPNETFDTVRVVETNTAGIDFDDSVFENTTIEDFSDDLSEQFETWKKEYREHSHRIKNVPLCADDCDSWYDACKDELTCTNDWYSGFTWEKGYDGTWHNLCKNTTEKACKPISFYYSNSKDFCQGIFPDDYQVVSSKDVCISFIHPEHNYNASIGHDSRHTEEIWIGGSILGLFGLVTLTMTGVFLWRRRTFFFKISSSNSDITTSLANNDELSQEVSA